MSAERLTRPRHGTIADQMVEVLKASGVRRVYGLPGDSLNGLTDALRRDGEIAWQHVRHEEAAAFAAAGEAAVTGELAVCAASCGPGNLHLINGLFDAHRSRVPVLAIAAHIPRDGDRRRVLPGDPSAGAVPRVQRVLRAGQRPRAAAAAAARSRCAPRSSGRGVAVLVVPGEVFLARARRRRREPRPIRRGALDRAPGRRGPGRGGRGAQRGRSA